MSIGTAPNAAMSSSNSAVPNALILTTMILPVAGFCPQERGQIGAGLRFLAGGDGVFEVE